MSKITINVPENKIGKINKQPDGNILITFEDVEHWKSIKTITDAMCYLEDHNMCEDLLEEYRITKDGSYSEKVALYRLVVAALTNNEECHLTTGDRWFPVVQFCEIGKEKNCWGDKQIGIIKHDGRKYTVVGGSADVGSNAGLGFFYSYGAVSFSWTLVGFRSVSRKDVAEHISKYFGRLLFEVQYGGTNCDWEWC